MGDNRQLSKYKVINIDAPVNHVHYKDVISVIEKMIEVKSSAKLYNVVAPKHPTKKEVISAQKGQWSQVCFSSNYGRLVSSKKIEDELGYTFIYPNPNSFHLSSNSERN